MKRGEPLKRKTEMKRTGRVKPKRAEPRRTAHQTGEELSGSEWHNAVIFRAYGQCEADLEDCTSRATEAHHRFRPGRLNTMPNGVALCSSCHTGSRAAIHRNEAWAIEVGLLIHSWEGPPAARWEPGLGTGTLPRD